MEIRINKLDELPDAASALLSFAGNERVFLFHGEMGAGKTTLIKFICHQMDVVDMAGSPTYSIVNEYDHPKGKVYHFDFFRIKSEAEAFDMGIEEYLSSGDYCFIEWPEMIPDLWPVHYLSIKIESGENESRILNVLKV